MKCPTHHLRATVICLWVHISRVRASSQKDQKEFLFCNFYKALGAQMVFIILCDKTYLQLYLASFTKHGKNRVTDLCQ